MDEIALVFRDKIFSKRNDFAFKTYTAKVDAYNILFSSKYKMDPLLWTWTPDGKIATCFIFWYPEEINDFSSDLARCELAPQYLSSSEWQELTMIRRSSEKAKSWLAKEWIVGWENIETKPVYIRIRSDLNGSAFFEEVRHLFVLFFGSWVSFCLCNFDYWSWTIVSKMEKFNWLLFCGLFLGHLFSSTVASNGAKYCYSTEECQCSFTDNIGYHTCSAAVGSDMILCSTYEYYYFSGVALDATTPIAQSSPMNIPGTPIQNSLIVDIEKTNASDKGVDCQVLFTIDSMKISNTFHTANGTQQTWEFPATYKYYKYLMQRVNCDVKLSVKVVPTGCTQCLYVPLECDL